MAFLLEESPAGCARWFVPPVRRHPQSRPVRRAAPRSERGWSSLAPGRIPNLKQRRGRIPPATYVTVGIHHPKPGKEQAILETMARFGGAQRGRRGLITVFGWKDDRTGALIGTAL